MSKNSGGPYRVLGKQLKALRLRTNESLAEASGAVEIDVRDLASYELGQVRPSEDVLLLLISHFGAHDDEAVRMWEMAGYGSSRISSAQQANDETSVLLPGDAGERILFTDVVDVTVNNYGVVMNFMQSNGTSGRPSTVARVGMSREHAKSILEILKLTLAQTEQPAKNISQKTVNDNSEKTA